MGVFAVIVLVLAGLGWWTTGTARAEVQAQVDRETADSVRLARTIALMETLEARRDTIERKIDVIRSVDGRRYVWPHILDEVSRAVPPFTWLTKLASSEEAPAPVAAAAPAPGATPADSARPRGAAPAPAGRAPPSGGGPPGSTQAYALQ
jgi:Tfp pilus assembly protein PilN